MDTEDKIVASLIASTVAVVVVGSVVGAFFIDPIAGIVVFLLLILFIAFGLLFYKLMERYDP